MPTIRDSLGLGRDEEARKTMEYMRQFQAQTNAASSLANTNSLSGNRSLVQTAWTGVAVQPVLTEIQATHADVVQDGSAVRLDVTGLGGSPTAAVFLRLTPEAAMALVDKLIRGINKQLDKAPPVQGS